MMATSFAPSRHSTRCAKGMRSTVVDAIGGTSPEAHRAGLDRVMQAGGHPISWVSLAVELQRDWARQDTVQAIIEIVLTDRLLKEQ